MKRMKTDSQPRLIRNFRVIMPECPACQSEKTLLDVFALSNLVRVPIGLFVAYLIGRPPLQFGFKCRACKARFLAEPDPE
jgi:hypothetical protein